VQGHKNPFQELPTQMLPKEHIKFHILSALLKTNLVFSNFNLLIMLYLKICRGIKLARTPTVKILIQLCKIYNLRQLSRKLETEIDHLPINLQIYNNFSLGKEQQPKLIILTVY
jgi:hypothetical protein